MENSVKISILLEIYGGLLTEKQYSLLDNYYNKDLSLSEIAENQEITRQAVRDNLKKGENNLFEYEKKLKLMKKFEMQKKELEEIVSQITEIEANKEVKQKLESLKKKILIFQNKLI